MKGALLGASFFNIFNQDLEILNINIKNRNFPLDIFNVLC